MSDPEDTAIDVTIEALTGTVYDLCVSPYETILGIKLKIQRLEGKPIRELASHRGNCTHIGSAASPRGGR